MRPGRNINIINERCSTRAPILEKTLKLTTIGGKINSWHNTGFATCCFGLGFGRRSLGYDCWLFEFEDLAFIGSAWVLRIRLVVGLADVYSHRAQGLGIKVLWVRLLFRVFGV